MTNNHTGRLTCSREFVCSLIPAALPPELLRNVTLGWFLEADQLRELNFTPQPHACSVALRGIIDEECDIMQKYFRFHLSNCPQLKRGGGLLKAELEVLKWGVVGLFICNLHEGGSISGMRFAFLFTVTFRLK